MHSRRMVTLSIAHPPRCYVALVHCSRMSSGRTWCTCTRPYLRLPLLPPPPPLRAGRLTTSTPEAQCQLVSVGVSWCQLVSVGVSWAHLHPRSLGLLPQLRHGLGPLHVEHQVAHLHHAWRCHAREGTHHRRRRRRRHDHARRGRQWPAPAAVAAAAKPVAGGGKASGRPQQQWLAPAAVAAAAAKGSGGQERSMSPAPAAAAPPPRHARRAASTPAGARASRR
jgi:hypothetical protein